MAHGQPDFGAYAARSTVFGQADLGELAARLGYVGTFNRSGDVVWFDDFESPVLKWTVTAVGGSVVLSTASQRLGSQSALLTTSAAAASSAQIAKWLPPAVKGKIGVETNLAHVTNTVSYYELIHYYYDTRPQMPSMEFRYYPATGTVQIQDNLLGWVSLEVGHALQQNIRLFNNIKLVGDFLTRKYVRLVFNETTYDLSQYDLVIGVHAQDPHMYTIFLLRQVVAAAKTCYVDDVIITQNEP